jgi:acyl carrier protein
MTSYEDTRETLSRLWQQALDGSTGDQVEDRQKFFVCGGDSVTAIKLFMETVDQLRVEIDPTEFLETLAVGDFDDLVRLAHAATGKER